MGLAELSEMELVCLSIDEDGDINVVDHLIWGNKHINPNLPSPHPDFTLMNGAQRALATLAELEGEVLNGGISQYLFNRPQQVGMLLDGLSLMEWPEFERTFRKALSGLDTTMTDELVRARNVWDEEPEFADRWAAFRSWSETFSGGPFDDWFYAHNTEFTQRLMQMVWRLRAQLITGVSVAS